MSPEAGWYADPTDDTAVRWWDGTSWSTETRPAPREMALAGAVVGTADTAATSVAAVPLAPIVTVGGPAPGPPNAAAQDADEDVDRSRPGSRRPVPAADLDLSEEEVDRSRPGSRRPAVVPPPEQAADEDVDRSRPGARRPVAVPPPVEVVDAPGAGSAPRPAAPPPVAWVDGSAVPGHASPGFGGASVGHAPGAPLGFTTAPAGFGPADGPVHVGGYAPRRSWKVPVAVGVTAVVLLGGAAVVGVPRYQAAQAQAKAAQAPDVLLRSAPRTLAGQRRLVVPGLDTAGLAAKQQGSGAAWAWAAAYGTKDAVTLYLASDVALSLRPEAVKALTSRDAATTMLGEISSGITASSSGQAVTGTPAEYASPVGGKTWCMPVTMSGVAGGYCLWTSGKEMLQVLSLPGLDQVAAKSTTTALAEMAAAVTKASAGAAAVPAPKPSSSVAGAK